MNKQEKIFNALLKNYGEQKWWPTTLDGELHPSYHGRGVLNEMQRFEIIAGAILTQNTSWKNVEKAIFNINKLGMMSPENIISADEKNLAQAIKPAGYYNQKAKKLKNAALLFISLNGMVPDREELLCVNGIGPETADSILLYAYNINCFVVDAYTKRIFSRLGICSPDASYNEVQEIFHKSMRKDSLLFKEYHALIVEHAKIHCAKKPLCKGCCLSKYCERLI